VLVSVDSQELERSVLERKDRDELQSIATAMGGKVPSRARKAEIVDQILELAGVTSGGGEAAPDTEAEREPAADETTSRRAPAKRSATKRTNGATTADVDEADGAATTDEPSSNHGEPGGRGRADGGDEAETRTGDRNASANERDDQAGDDRDGGDRPRGGDQPEPGNRRRRRRGRDRGGRDDEPWTGEPVEFEGLLDLRDEGYGFLRVNGYLPSKDDVYVSVKQVRQFQLRRGDQVKGAGRPASRNEKNPALIRIDEVNGVNPDEARARPRFEDLTPLFPDERLRLERRDEPGDMTARIIDLIAPIGKGQRGLIVSPPKAGKTTVMKRIAQSIEANNPEVTLMVLLVDERPEEVTDMRRSVQGEVIASTFDRPSEEHTAVAELTIERAKRLVEAGQDVVIILDGITRLARAYNLAAPATGRIMSGGIDTGALYPPKKFFGAARNIEEGGSLTILASALIETGSKMDEVIFEEFKGTGNMELRLDRRAAERRIYPAIDVDASSTRHEELLFEKKQLQMVWKLRRVLSGLAADGSGSAGLEMLIERLASFSSNDEFLAEVAKAPAAGA
jgi:transcription termination factor Rho